MKSGMIVGIISSCTLIVAGIAACAVGVVMANNNGQSLFTQKKDGGTYYSTQISDSVTELRVGLEDADITVIGGAEQSKIEFFNFNPNYYSLSVMKNVIDFEEVSDLRSMVNIWESGLTFKGLRYALDIRNFRDKGDQHRVIVSLAEGCSLKIIDISAENSNLLMDDVSLSGDINISVKYGNVSMSDTSTGSLLSITGEDIVTVLDGTESATFRYSATDSNLDVQNSRFSDADITLGSGRVDFVSSVTMDDTAITAVTESGRILVNSKPQEQDYITYNEELDRTLYLKTVAADINIEFPADENK